MNNCVLCNKENPKLVCDECVKTTLKDKILCLEGRRINGEIEISGRYEIVDESDFWKVFIMREKTMTKRYCQLDEEIFGKIDWKR